MKQQKGSLECGILMFRFALRKAVSNIVNFGDIIGFLILENKNLVTPSLLRSRKSEMKGRLVLVFEHYIPFLLYSCGCCDM